MRPQEFSEHIRPTPEQYRHYYGVCIGPNSRPREELDSCLSLRSIYLTLDFSRKNPLSPPSYTTKTLRHIPNSTKPLRNPITLNTPFPTRNFSIYAGRSVTTRNFVSSVPIMARQFILRGNSYTLPYTALALARSFPPVSSPLRTAPHPRLSNTPQLSSYNTQFSESFGESNLILPHQTFSLTHSYTYYDP